jgi:hypothetical protein
LYSLLCRHESRLSFVFVFFAFGFIFGFARLWPLAGTRTGIHFTWLFVIGIEPRRHGIGLGIVGLSGVSTLLLLDCCLAGASRLLAQATRQHLWVLGWGLVKGSGLVRELDTKLEMGLGLELG